MELGVEGFDLLQQLTGQFLARAHGNARNVINRLFRVKLRALPTRPVENVHQMAFEVEKTEFKHGEQPDGTGADNDDVGFEAMGQASRGSVHSTVVLCVN